MIKKISAFAAALTLTASAAGMLPYAGEANTLKAIAAEDTTDLPSSVDLSTSEYFPGVFNQGNLGSCASSSTTFYQFTFAARKALREKDSEADINFVYSPAFTYPQINGGADNGSNEKDAYTLFKYNGAITLDKLKYDRYYGINKDKKNRYYARDLATGEYISFEKYASLQPYEKSNYYVEIVANAGRYYENYLVTLSNLSKYEKDQFEETDNGLFRRKGEYISADAYNALDYSDKKFYIPVINSNHFQGIYFHLAPVFRAIPRDEQALFDALKIRLVDSYTKGINASKTGPGQPPEFRSEEEMLELENEVIEEIKEALYEKKLVVVSAQFNHERYTRDEVVKNNQSFSEQAVYQNDNYEEGGNHSFTIVGYDDEIGCDINGNGKVDADEYGAFKVVNSWGEGNHTNGFFWLMYDAVHGKSLVYDMPDITRTYTGSDGKSKTLNRVRAINGMHTIEAAVKDIKLVSEAQVITNNYYDINPDASCDGKQLNIENYKYGTPVVYSGPVFTDITDLCADGCGNGKDYNIILNNKNNSGKTKVLVKSICIKDDKGTVVASKEYTDRSYSDAVIGEDFSDSLSIDLPKGDMNYDGVFDQNDWDEAAELYRIKMSFGDSSLKEKEVRKKYSLFQEELLDANDNGVIDPEDYYTLEARLNS